jgi:hypothetical protein
VLGERAEIGVVAQHRQPQGTQSLAQDLRERDVVPVEVGRETHQAVLGADDARHADADAHERRVGLDVLDDQAHQVDDRGADRGRVVAGRDRAGGP